MGGQLQRYRNNKALECAAFPADGEPAFAFTCGETFGRYASVAEEPRPLVILDEHGHPLTRLVTMRAAFRGLHGCTSITGNIIFLFYTGDTHLLCYATGDNPYGPFTYQGVILQPVVGWTTHHAIVEYKGKWYLFHHDCVPSGEPLGCAA